MYNIIDRYFIVWSFFIPITTVVLTTAIKGVLISYVFALISPFIIFLFKKNKSNYIATLISCIFIYCILILISQLSNEIFNINLKELILVNESDYNVKVFRNSLFTQSLYLFCGILTFFFVKYNYSLKWDKWIVYSGFLFALYGIYEFIIFLLLGINGDFLSNRIYNDGVPVIAQYLDIAGITIQRVDSLAMEPSMFAFTLLPYFIFSVMKKAPKIIIYTVFISLILSTSTTAYIGLLIYILCLLMNFKKYNIKLKYVFFLLITLSLSIILFYAYISDIVQFMILNKFAALNSSSEAVGAGVGSGLQRSANFLVFFFYWCNLDILHEFFGIGYGFARSTDLFSTLLVNTGFIGLLIYVIFSLKKFRFRVNNIKDISINAILLSTFIVMMISVPEMGFLSYWLFLGIIYSKTKL